VIIIQLNEQPQDDILWTRPSAECLPYLQALLIPLIIFTYRGLGQFSTTTMANLQTIMSNMHFFDLLQRAGAYQQERIDEASCDPAIRQQYQR
jgi:uncharacterized membrane-anchored protein YitT (DUF2179 family)